MKKLIEVLKIQSTSYNQDVMRSYIIRECKAIGCTVKADNGNVYVKKGNATLYPCMVAHMDTVHAIKEDLTVVEIAGNLYGFDQTKKQLTGIGGDDKVGIYITLELLRRHEFMKAVFFRDEEVGCVGSYKAKTRWFNDCSFVLQCDRRGSGDFITDAGGTELSGKEFQEEVIHPLIKYGYSFEHGMMTDVMALKEQGVSCCAANMSCGYYNPHFDNEFVVPHQVKNCLEMCSEIFTSMAWHRWEHTAPKNVYHFDDESFRDTWDKAKKAWVNKNKSKAESREPVSLCVDCQYQMATLHGFCDDCYDYYVKSFNRAPSASEFKHTTQSTVTGFGIETNIIDKPEYND